MKKQTFWPRFGAWFFDYAVVFAFTWWFVMTNGEPNDDGGYTVTGLAALAVPAFWFFWIVLPEGLWGATLGKKIIGLKIVKTNGQSLGMANAIGRRICDVIDFSLSFGIVAAVCFKNSPIGQRLGDRAMNAVVILAEDYVSPLDAIAANKAEM
jgi:uncharacterized RDD family membrane protein YckC